MNKTQMSSLAAVQELIGRTLTWSEWNISIKFETIEAIVVTGQMHGILLIDDKLQPCTSLITWRDQRAADTPDN